MVVPFRVTTDGNTVPSGLRNTNVEPLTPLTASLNVTERLFTKETAVAAFAGARAVITGAGPVRNVQDTLTYVFGTSAASRIAVAPPVNATVYSVSLTKLPVGLRIH